MEHFKLVFGSGTSDLAKIRPLKIWTAGISPWVPPYGILPLSASFIVGFVRVVIVGQEWLRQVQQSSRTRGTDSIGDAICLMVLQLLGSNLESRVG